MSTVAEARRSTWYGLKTYVIRWGVVGFVAGLVKPVLANPDQFWAQKGIILMQTIPLGLACGVLFTVAQNKLNPKRHRALSYLMVFLCWLATRLAYVGALYAVGVHTS